MAEKSPSASIIRLITRLVLIVVILAAAALGYFALVLSAPTVQTSDAGVDRMTVPVIEVKRVPVRRQWLGQGVAEALDQADIPVRVSSTVQWLDPEALPGAAVKAGEVFVRLDASDFERQVAQQEQTLKSLQAELELLNVQEKRLAERLKLAEERAELLRDEAKRISVLFENKAAGRQGVDAARRAAIEAEQIVVELNEALDQIPARRQQLQAQIDAQQQTLRLAKLNLQRTEISSPIDGFFEQIDIEVGEHVTPGMRIARVVNLDRMEVALRLPAAARTDLQLGDDIRLHSVSNPELAWQSSIQRISPQDDGQTRTLTVYTIIEQADQVNTVTSANAQTLQMHDSLLRPGVYLTGRVTSSRQAEQFVVPQRAVRSGRVNVIEDGVVQPRDVKTLFAWQGKLDAFALPDDDWVVVGEGLEPGEQVMVNISTAVMAGEQVEPVPAAQSPNASGDINAAAHPAKQETPS